MAAKKEATPKPLNTTRRSANAAAHKRLAEMWPQKFRDLQAEEYKKRGLELEPTPEEKAEDQLHDLLARFPQLRDKVDRPDAVPPEEPE